jgi:hypothetical protein
MDNFPIADNVRDKINVTLPKDFQERCEVAETCEVKLSLKMPAVIDGMDNATEQAYTAWPDRLYVIDRDGRVGFKGKPGSYGFKPAAMAAYLKQILPD